MKIIGKSVEGLCRANNEDAIYIGERDAVIPHLFAVADGMGGYNAGEIASNTAMSSFISYTNDEQKKDDVKEEILDMLVGGISYANKIVYEKSKTEKELAEMGTTFVAAVIQDEKLYVAYVGDSRAYIFRDKKLCQITWDHSYVMDLVKAGTLTEDEAFVHPDRNIITRAVGTAENIEIDTYILNFRVHDMILLCSDGLSTMIRDAEIEEILKRECSLDDKLQMLINLANEKGGRDNISIILAEE